ncbi:alpha/beta fold hydrolase [Azorhizobium oxalatiphilum]|nr:hypothetical protein [Azorhizobium oxalatiphilum]
MFDEVSRDGTKVWHFHFHQAPDLPEALMQGREAQIVSVTTIPNAGHWLAENNPEAVADALVAFASQENAR